MAIYHLAVKSVSRSTGRSSVAAAAYRCGQRLVNARDGETHDYRARSGVEAAEIVLPAQAPAWMRDRSALWNSAEQAEIRKDAKTAREYEVALPHELDAAGRLELARDLARYVSDRFGVAADFSIHEPHDRIDTGPETDAPGGDPRNWHIHLLTTTRRVTPEGLGEKTRELDVKQTSADLVEEIRAKWTELANKALEKAGEDARIDHRSFERQGLDVKPTTHLGKESVALMREGVVNNRIEDWREARTAQVIDLARERAKRQNFKQEKPYERFDHRRPSYSAQSHGQALERAKSRETLPWWRHGVQHVSQLPVAAHLPSGAGGVLPGPARPDVAERPRGDRPAVFGQQPAMAGGDAAGGVAQPRPTQTPAPTATPAAAIDPEAEIERHRREDLQFLQQRIKRLGAEEDELEPKARKVWTDPAGKERPLFRKDTVAGQQRQVAVRYTLQDARRHLQPKWQERRDKMEALTDRLQDLEAQAKETGWLKRTFGGLKSQIRDTKRAIAAEKKALDTLDRKWKDGGAQKGEQLLTRAEAARAKAVTFADKVERMLEEVRREKGKAEKAYDTLKDVKFEPSPRRPGKENTQETEGKKAAETARQQDLIMKHIEQQREIEERRRVQEAIKRAEEIERLTRVKQARPGPRMGGPGGGGPGPRAPGPGPKGR